jgi:hypothetical protein
MATLPKNLINFFYLSSSPDPPRISRWREWGLKVDTPNFKGSPAPTKTSEPPTGEAGEGVKIEYRGGYCATTNKRWVRVVYSIKNNKFVKGYFKGDRVSGDIVYSIFPGRYIIIIASNYPKLDPPKEIVAKIIQLKESGDEVIKERRIKFYNSAFLESLNLPPQLLHVWEYVPGYHSGKTFDFNKVFTAEETRKLLEWIEEGGDIVEGMEVE